MADANLRRLGYFVAVADCSSFGRAAERVHVTQPVLSRQIAVLERELGAVLFERSSGGAALTDAGRALLDDARDVLRAAEALERRARLAGRGVRRLAIGFMPGLIVTPIVQGLRQSFPDLEVDMIRTGWDDQVETILDGRVDLGLVRLPIPTRGLRVEPLFAEARVAVVAIGHPLAGRAELRVGDLTDFELLQDPDAVPEWRDARLRRGLPVEASAAHPKEVEVKLERVAAGLGVSVLPISTARFYRRPDVVVKQIAGLGPSEIGAAWAEGRDDAVLRRAVELTHALRASLTTERALDEESAVVRS